MMIDLPSRGYRGRVYLGSFLRYRPLWIQYEGDEKLTNYQVKCTLTNQDIPFKKLRLDKQDLLFITYEGEAVPYWIESANSSQIIVWLKFSEIIPGKEVFWLYYGNGKFLGVSDGVRVFEFFDDFKDLSGWVNDAGYTISNSELVQDANVGYENKKFYYSNYEPSDIRNLAIRWKWRGTSGGIVSCGWRHSDGNWNGVVWRDGDSNGDAHIRERWDSHSFSESTYGTTDNNIPQDGSTNYVFEFRADASNFYLVVNDVEYAQSDIDYADTPMHVGYSSYNSGYPAYSDWILVRKYTSPEPLVVS